MYLTWHKWNLFSSATWSMHFICSLGNNTRVLNANLGNTVAVTHFHTGCWNVSHNQQPTVFWGLHQPGRSTNHKHWLTWVITNNSPSQNYTNPDDQPTTNIDSSESQQTTVLLRTTPTWTINQPQTLTDLGHNQQQSISGLHQPGRSTNHKHWLAWVQTFPHHIKNTLCNTRTLLFFNIMK